MSSSALLREAARIVHEGRARTGCDATSMLLPRDTAGDAAWWRAKWWLSFFLPPEGFETRYGWWRESEPRVLGMLMAAALAESEGD